MHRPVDRPEVRETPIIIPPMGLEGTLAMPEEAKGVVLFAHGSGSSRLSIRNRAVAGALHRAGLATLLFDLLTEAEANDRRNVFDISLLAARLVAAIDHLAASSPARALPVGLFGASTGAAAALIAAASRPAVRAVVSRGGRPDLVPEEVLAQVPGPTLLIVGGEDHEVLALNRLAQARITAPCDLLVVPGATHLFEEQGALDEVARAASDWFCQAFSAEMRHGHR